MRITDLQLVDPLMYRNLTWLLENPVDSSLELTFSVQEELLGVHLSHPLIANGEKILIDDSNKH